MSGTDSRPYYVQYLDAANVVRRDGPYGTARQAQVAVATLQAQGREVQGIVRQEACQGRMLRFL